MALYFEMNKDSDVVEVASWISSSDINAYSLYSEILYDKFPL